MATWSSTIEPTAASVTPVTTPEGDHILSAAASASLHADAVSVTRWELVLRLPFLVAALLSGAFVIVIPEMALMLGPIAVSFAVWYGGAVFEWLRLRQTPPSEHFLREQQKLRDERALATQIAEHQARRSTVRPRMTQGLLVAVAAVSLVQFALPGIERSVELAALVKPATRAGEWWRLLSSSYLHGSLLHVATNLSALVALGGLIELYDRRMRVPLVYLAGVAGGGLASLLFTPGPSLGASAGVLALAAYLLMLGRLQAPGLPKWLQRQMLSMLAGTALLGVVGFLFIDNAAHAGGVVAGLVVGRALGPTRTGRTPLSGADRASEAAGWAAAVVLTAGAVFTIGRLMQVW